MKDGHIAGNPKWIVNNHSITEPTVPMNWQEFVENAVKEGWELRDTGFLTLKLRNAVELTIYKDYHLGIDQEGYGYVTLPAISYELAYAAANAVAEAVGGWRE